MTLNEASGSSDQPRRNRPAPWQRAPATRMEAAAGGRVKRIGKGRAELAGWHTKPGLRREHSPQQGDAIRMQRRSEEAVGLGLLDDATKVHDRNPCRQDRKSTRLNSSHLGISY